MQIDISISSATTKRVIVIGVVGAAVAAASLAWAELKVWKDPPPTPPEILMPKDLNGNFASLQAEIVDVKAQVSDLVAANATLQGDLAKARVREFKGRSYSLGAVYVGATSTTLTGSFVVDDKTGYEAAKLHCQRRAGGTPTAHMCTGEELTRSGQLGIKIDTGATNAGGWYAAGVNAIDLGKEGSGGTASYYAVGQHDCFGWTETTYNNQPILGAVWRGAPGVPAPAGGDCARGDLYRILCCD